MNQYKLGIVTRKTIEKRADVVLFFPGVINKNVIYG
jgi:hypothetical protein